MRVNELPPKDSNWYSFATVFDVGILDLNKFAYLMNFDDFADLDISISPKSLFERDKEKFAQALRQSSVKVEDMTDSEIQSVIKEIMP